MFERGEVGLKKRPIPGKMSGETAHALFTRRKTRGHCPDPLQWPGIWQSLNLLNYLVLY